MSARSSLDHVTIRPLLCSALNARLDLVELKLNKRGRVTITVVSGENASCFFWTPIGV